MLYVSETNQPITVSDLRKLLERLGSDYDSNEICVGSNNDRVREIQLASVQHGNNKPKIVLVFK